MQQGHRRRALGVRLEVLLALLWRREEKGGLVDAVDVADFRARRKRARLDRASRHIAALRNGARCCRMRLSK